MFLQEGVDVTNPMLLLAAAGSNSSAQFTAAAQSIVVAIAAGAQMWPPQWALWCSQRMQPTTQRRARPPLNNEGAHWKATEVAWCSGSMRVAHSLWIQLGLELYPAESDRRIAWM